MLNAIIPELVFHLENNTLCSKIRKAVSYPTMGDYKFIKKNAFVLIIKQS